MAQFYLGKLQDSGIGTSRSSGAWGTRRTRSLGTVVRWEDPGSLALDSRRQPLRPHPGTQGEGPWPDLPLCSALLVGGV